MDFDFIDETRPRFQIQSGPFTDVNERKEISKKHLAVCIGTAALLLSYSWTLSSVPQLLVVWLALSLLLGPFAPLSLTGGVCRVGLGDLLPEEEQVGTAEAGSGKRTFKQDRSIKNQEITERGRPYNNSDGVLPATSSDGECVEGVARDSSTMGALLQNGSLFKRDKNEGEGEEWTKEEIELLRKQMVKYPRGKLRRWEVIAEAFGGAHSVDSIVKMTKTLSAAKPSDDNSFSRFLAQRKELDKTITAPLSERWGSDGRAVETEAVNDGKGTRKVAANLLLANGDAVSKQEEKDLKGDWMATEDRALLTALKTFPKETSMRWDKVALAVPGRTKAQCFKRFAELREKFRNNRSETVPELEQ